MGLFSALGATAGFLLSGGTTAGASLGASLGGLLDGKPKGNKQLDAYTAYKLQREKKWDAMFGPLEENLVAHYKNLSATQHIAKNNEALEVGYKMTQDRLKTELANRGLNLEGGIGLGATTQMLSDLAKQKATVYAQADDWVTQQQSQFYAQQRAGKPDAGNAVAANAETTFAQQQYGNKMQQAETAGIIDILDKSKDILKPITLSNRGGQP
jgi:type II secretory pathway component PulJ